MFTDDDQRIDPRVRLYAPHLTFLTENEDERELARHYWVGWIIEGFDSPYYDHAVEELAAERGMTGKHLREFLATRVRAVAGECESCAQSIVLRSRADLQAVRCGRMTVCPTCKDRAKAEQKAEAQRQADEQRRAAEARRQLLGRKIEATVAGAAPREPVLDELALREAAYLVAVERLAGADGLLAFDLADRVRLAPTQELGDTILRTLYAEGYLALEPHPPADAFELDERDELTVIDYWSCRWRLAEMSDLRSAVRSGWRPAGWERDALRVWKQVAVHECLGYAARRVNYEAAGLVLVLTDELAGAIDDALGVFSTGQVYCLIWGAARDLRGREVFDGFEAARRLTAGIERRRSGRVTSESERAVRPFDRDRKPTLLCEVLYDDLLKIGTRGFTERPHQFRADAP